MQRVPSGVSPPPLLPALLYQGSVNTWECDEGGHLNVRFHAERAMTGLAHLARHLVMPDAFAETGVATMLPVDLHVRFHNEARPGEPLNMQGAVIELGETDATVCLDMRLSDGRPSSVFTLRVAHVVARDLRPFPWSSRTRAAAAVLTRPLPEHATPRSINVLQAPAPGATLARAQELGAIRIGASMVLPDQCDAFGRLRAEHVFGRASDSVPNLLAQWRRDLAAGASQAKSEAAGAVVEARIHFRRWPRVGDLIEIYSGVVEAAGKTLRLTHWFCDPESGAAWASMEVVALTFDTVTRKAMAPSDAVLAAMQQRLVRGLTI
ncbi:MAG: acyl-CoA thioesterase [Hyphomonadaceae bacterium]